MNHLTIALDVMGGDIGPRITIPASIKALAQDPELRLCLFGDRQQIQPILDELLANNQPAESQAKQHKLFPNILQKRCKAQSHSTYTADELQHYLQRIEIFHTPFKIENNQSLRSALRHSKETSMRLALECVQQGKAQACVSAGNTGALLGLSSLLIQAIDGIERPALVSLLPTFNQQFSLMLDLGANVHCEAQNLYQFALMGAIFAEHRLNLVYPRLALLNIGIEEMKGYKALQQASELIKQDSRLNYQGFIEGDRLLNNDVDIIISDGFAGNVALKTLEGVAKNMLSLVKPNTDGKPFYQGLHWLVGKLGAKYFSPRYQKLARFKPEKYNGASMLGLNSVVVKSHGSANINGFANAINEASWQARQQIPAKIKAGLHP